MTIFSFSLTAIPIGTNLIIKSNASLFRVGRLLEEVFIVKKNLIVYLMELLRLKKGTFIRCITVITLN